MTKFPHIFTPLKVGGLVVKNRLFSAPMSAHALSAEGYMEPETVDFFELLAKGGVGLVCIGESLVHSATGNNHGRVLRLDDPGVVPGLMRCTDAIHAQGALASIELVHPGRRADPKYNAQGKTYGPSGGFCHYGDADHPVTELTEELIDTIVNAYGDAAEMAMLAGCDMVTVHGGHGWLLNQFLSPANNQRTDRFGGSLENRARVFLMVADNIRAKCGPDFPIDFRISGDDLMEGGAALRETVELANMLAPKIDLLHVSATSFHNPKACIRMFPSMFHPRGCNAYLAEEIKRHVDIPVVTVGGFDDPAQMEEKLAAGRVDAIAMARALLADPFWPDKALHGREDDIVYCLRCNNCMSTGFVPYVKYSGLSHCPVNPWHGMASQYLHRQPARGKQRVLVAGGGPAGMEAALGAAECGHQVILCEETDSLGGMVRYAWNPPFKKDMRRFVEVLARRVEAAPNIERRLNTRVDKALVETIAPDALIVAIGGKPALPPIPGLDGPGVISFCDIHKPTTKLGEEIVIIGGGLTGCEEGLALAQEGKRVRILEMTAGLASTATYIHYISLLKAMEKVKGLLRVELNCRCERVDAAGVRCRNAAGGETVYPADTVIVAAGLRARREDAEAFRGLAPEVAIVGDCYRSAALPEAVRAGYFAGYNLQRS